jgi:hypothetical protein
VKALLIGQAPSRDGATNFEGSSGKFLATLCGLSHAGWMDLFERVNVLQNFPGRKHRGDHFPIAEAIEVAERMDHLLRRRRSVFIGLRVATAFGMRIAPLTWYPVPYEGEVALCPHSSGLSRWWNDANNRKDAERFWRDLCEDEMREQRRRVT